MTSDKNPVPTDMVAFEEVLTIIERVSKNVNNRRGMGILPVAHQEKTIIPPPVAMWSLAERENVRPVFLQNVISLPS